MKKLPIVALIGQTNAGKSSLLNRFAHKNIAIVAREEGTTRDNVMARIDNRFILIDTAGLKDPEDDFEANIQDQIADAIDAADVICLTLDSSKYPDDKDKQIAKSALKSKKPVLLLLNKSDLGEALDTSEFLHLGIKPDQTFRISATTGQGIKELKTAINVILKTGASSLPDGTDNQAGAGPNHGPLGLDSESATAPRAETSRQDPVRCSVNTAALKVTVPKWRTDIHIKEDIIEEVGRLLGYDNIALSLPTRPFIEATIDPLISLKTELRAILSDNLSMHELLTYSFVSQSLLEKVGMEVDNSYEIVNSISPELQRFRQQIVPSLLDKVRENLKSGHRDFCLYEMNQVSVKSAGLTSEGTPQLKMHLGIVDLGDFYQLKMKLLAMFRELKVSLEYKQLSPETAKHDSYLEPKRSAEIFVQGQKIGAFGEVRAAVLRQFKLDKTVSALELNLEKLSTCTREMKTKFKLSKFPFVERDLTLKVDEEAPFGRFDQVLVGYFDEKKLIAEVTPVSIYQGDDTATKNLSFHLKFSDPEKTLKTEEISAIMEEITIAVSQIGAEVV